MKLNYKHTLTACYVGYITQAEVNNLPPLLFLIFCNTFGISLGKIAVLIAANFIMQTIIDILSPRIVGALGVRGSMVAAHFCTAAGFAFMGVFPYILPDPFAGLLLSAALNSVGGGITEVLVSPIVDSLPGDAKSSAMSLLHSFYCWGQVLVVMLTTAFFSAFGTESWRLVTAFWAVIPFANAFLFLKVPLRPFVEEGGEEIPFKKLFGYRLFILFCVLMLCAGASELAASQWASLFAEAGLKVSKTAGDLLGPCMFAVLMGTARLLYGIFGKKIKLVPMISASSVLCVVSYLAMVFAPVPLLSLAGCAVCGLSVGIMWPGVFSLASEKFPNGGTSMFSVLALAGDLGCTSGPALVGVFVKLAENGSPLLFADSGAASSGLRTGLLFAVIFPVLMLVGMKLLSGADSGKANP
ncbi:MAG: MFS transporter [Oscillospiraceae bacterium]|nr:MFS transporter [Oscillospiraceae bacterium]